MKNIFFAIALSLTLVGCKTEMEVPVKLSDFTKTESVTTTGAMAIEIPSCTEPDSDMPSDSVFKLQKKIPYVFKGAEYIKCTKHDFKSYVVFKFPVNIDNVVDGKVIDEQMINLSYLADNDGHSLFVKIPPKLQESINTMIKSNMYSDINDMQLSLNIDPEGKKTNFSVIGAYLDGNPVQIGSFTNNGKEFKITIPAYGIERMLKSEQGSFMALMGAKSVE